MQTRAEVVAPRAGAMVRQDFGASELSVQAETASSAVAAQARAAVESRYKMALLRPRDVDDARTRLLRECKRPGFAKKAIYHKPVGKGVEGPSIRLAEAAVRLMGNILVESPTIYDDPHKRIIRVVATDLETNATYQSDIVLEKTVERQDAGDRVVVAERLNKSGRKVFIVQATEDELLNKVNALVSKAVRTNGLRLVPADVLEEALAQCRATMRDEDAKDPDAAKKRIADAFAELRVTPGMLKEYLGHELGTVSPNELEVLRGIYASIKDGETSWQAVLEQRREEQKDQVRAPEAPPASAPVPQVQANDPKPEPTPAPVAQAAPVPTPVGPDRVDGFLDQVRNASTVVAIDQLSKGVKDIAPPGHPRRDEVGKAINDARRRVKGGGGQ